LRHCQFSKGRFSAPFFLARVFALCAKNNPYKADSPRARHGLESSPNAGRRGFVRIIRKLKIRADGECARDCAA